MKKEKDLFDHPFCQNDDFNEAFNDFLNMRKKLRKPATERAIKNLLKNVIDRSGADLELAIKIIDQSITNCWLDFYKLKEEQNENAGFSRKREEI